MDTLERLITDLKRDRRVRDPSPQPSQDHLTDASCNSPEDPWSRLAQLEAHLRFCDTLHDEHSTLTESDYSRDSLYPPSASLEIHVDWTIVNRELLQRGLPPVLGVDSEDGLPTPEAAYTAMQSALRELTRLHRQAESLRSAAEMAGQREAAALRKLRMEAQNIPKAEKELQNLATKAQEDVARAKQSEASSRHAAKAASVEAAALKTSLDRLQRQLFAKSSENEALKQQLQDHLDKQAHIHLVAKESVKRIRQVFATERVNAGGGGHGGAFAGIASLEGSHNNLALIVKHPSNSSTSISTMNALQVAKIYENQLRAAEEETRAARAEISLLREKFETARLEKYPNSITGMDIYTNESSIAAKKIAKAESLAARAQEEAEVLREEICRRPAPEEHERLQRQTEIITRRLARLEKERDSQTHISKISSRSLGSSRGTRPTAAFFSSASSSQHQQHPQQQQLSRQVALEIIESTSSILKCTEILELPKVARQLQRTLASVPALQQFVDGVCQAVFRQGSAFVPWSLRHEEPSDVPTILLKWIEMLEDAEEGQDRLKELQKQQDKSLKIQQQQQQQVQDTRENNSNQSGAATAAAGKQMQPKVITVSRVAAGKGFPEIEIFAPARSCTPRRAF